MVPELSASSRTHEDASSPLLGGRSLSTTWQRYAAALVIVAIGMLARMALVPVFGQGLNYLTLYPAVTLASILGGFGPGRLPEFGGSQSVRPPRQILPTG
jgi:hypothetical protein